MVQGIALFKESVRKNSVLELGWDWSHLAPKKFYVASLLRPSFNDASVFKISSRIIVRVSNIDLNIYLVNNFVYVINYLD